MSDLMSLIDEANKKAGLARQRTVGKKFAARQTEAQIIATLCARITEAVLAWKANQSLAGPMANLTAAVRIAERHEAAK